jgi:hypothetical protein
MAPGVLGGDQRRVIQASSEAVLVAREWLALTSSVWPWPWAVMAALLRWALRGL